MATATAGKTQCVTCAKERVTYKCEGCAQNYCMKHLTDHQQVPGKQLDELEDKRNLLRHISTEQKSKPRKHSLVEQIDKWESESIKKIQQTADEARQLLVQHTGQHNDKIEVNLWKLTEELIQIREENDFNEIVLDELKQN